MTRGRLYHRRDFLKATGSGASVTAIAGCSDGNGTGNNRQGLPDTVKVGIVASGLDNPLGTSQRDAAKLAIEDLEARNALNGADFELHVADGKLTSSDARQAYQELTIRKEVDLTLGTTAGAADLAVLDEMSRQRKLHFAQSLAMDVPERINNDYEAHKYHFRPQPENSVQIGERYAQYVEEHYEERGWETSAFLIEDFDEILKIRDVAVDRIEDLEGHSVEMDQVYSLGTQNFGPHYDDVEAVDADICFAVYGLNGISATNQWAGQERPFELGGIHVQAFNVEFWQITDGAAESVWTLGQSTPESQQTPDTQPWMKRFIDEFEYSPQYTGPPLYDSLRMYAKAAEATGTTEEDTLVSQLEEMTFEDTKFYDPIDIQGPDSKWPHDTVWDESSLTPVVFQWQERDNGTGGAQYVIYPDEAASHSYQFPPWFDS